MHDAAAGRSRVPTRVASRLVALVPLPQVREHREERAKHAEDTTKCHGVRFQSG